MSLLLACGTTRDSTGPAPREASAPPDAQPIATAAPAPLPGGDVDAGAHDAGDGGEAADAPADAAGAERAAAEGAPPAGPPEKGRELARFHAALRELERGARRRHVRVAWFGDSHAAADFWTGGVRRGLQRRFGNAGVGFVHAGYREYRHDDVRIEVEGKWKIRPRQPATQTTVDDGVFGLGGLITSGYAESPRASLAVDGPGPRLLVDVCYRLPGPTDAFALTVTGSPRVIVRATPEEPPGALRHALATSAVPARIDLLPTSGRPELCGVIIETDPATKPGVVLDTLGINGARYATALAWNEETWGAELARRAPELVVLEYGTNEAGDFNVSPARYAKNLVLLVERIRKVKPDADIAIIGPSDRADTEDRVPPIRDALKGAAEQAGCWFWDTLTIMGGKGSIRAWRDETPPRAAKDGIHLVIKGYRELAEKLLVDLLQGLGPPPARPPG